MTDHSEDIFFIEDDEISMEKETWKILIVDDEKGIHAATKIALSEFVLDKKALSFISVYSGEEAKKILAMENDIALIFLDVVMETEDAGLLVVHYIRDVLKNHRVRIVLRTGQPGQAPEEETILKYDINDYKNKTELTSQNLFSVTVSSLRSYKHITHLNEYQEKLEKMVEERTQELAHSRAGMKIILDNIQLGIVIVNPDRTINQEYSQFMHKLFREENIIAGQPFESVYFWEKEREKDRKLVERWLGMVFNGTFEWNLIADLGPKLIQYKSGNDIIYYQNSYHPIIHDNKVTALMVNTSDVTQQKKLEIAIKEQEDAYSQEIEIISVIISQDREEFGKYLEKSDELLASAFKSLEILKKNENDFETCNQLFRKMHSLKGNSRAYSMKRLGKLAHEIEDILSDIRSQEITLQSELVNGKIAVKVMELKFDKMNSILTKAFEIYEKVVMEKEKNFGKIRKNANSITLDVEKLDQILKKCHILEDTAVKFKLIIAPGIKALKRNIYQLTLLNLDVAYNRFEKILNDVAELCGKDALFETRGDSIYLKETAHNLIVNSLIHMIRNAVDHGLETPDQREAMGKPAKGKIILETKQGDEEIKIQIQDDGAGLDPSSIIKKALSKDLIKEEEVPNMTKEEILQLILLPGFSSVEQVSEISGRGVGMDVVVDAVNQLGGSLDIQSDIKMGTTFTIILPRAGESNIKIKEIE